MGKVAIICDLFVANVLHKKLIRMVELSALARVHYQDPVSVDDRGQSVRNDHNGATLEDTLQLILNEVVRFQIDVGRGLVEHEYLRLPDDSPSEAEQLLLTHREDIVIVRDHGLQTILAITLDVAEQLDFF